MKKYNKGFTLIEIVVAVAILGVLAVNAIPTFINYYRKAKTTEATDALDKIKKKAEENFKRQNRKIEDGMIFKAPATKDDQEDYKDPNEEGDSRIDEVIPKGTKTGYYFQLKGSEGESSWPEEGPLWPEEPFDWSGWKESEDDKIAGDYSTEIKITEKDKEDEKEIVVPERAEEISQRTEQLSELREKTTEQRERASTRRGRT